MIVSVSSSRDQTSGTIERNIHVPTDSNGQACPAIGDKEGRSRTIEELFQEHQRLDAIGRMACGVAHDFNNSLSAILGAAQLVRDPSLSAQEREEFLDSLMLAAERASRLVRHLLDYSRKTAAPVFGPVDMGAVLVDTVAILRHAIDRKVRIELQRPSGIRTMVNGDETLLQNVLMNLGINAWHAMPDGGSLEFSLDETELDADTCARLSLGAGPGRFLDVSVRDTGAGMPPETVERIFDPFFSTKESSRGTGLGLALIRSTIVQHGGAVSVRSSPGAGTTFHVYLPLAAV